LSEYAEAGDYSYTGTLISTAITQDQNVGDYFLTGSGATLLSSAEEGLQAEPASYMIAGTDTQLNTHYSISCEEGMYAVAGINTSVAITQNSEATSHAISGTDLGITFVTMANVGNYAVTGSGATLLSSAEEGLQADAGTYAVLGADAQLNVHYSLVCEASAYAWVGTDTSVAITQDGY
jgi:hypothetical protein